MNPVLILLAVAVIFIYYFRRDLKEKFLPDKDRNLSIDDKYNARRKGRQDEIDELLSKIGKNGLNDLTPQEKKRLDELSQK